MLESHNIQEAAAREVVDLANKLADANPEADPWDIADGILSGAIHWWLFANTPCENADCDDCASIQTAELRMSTLRRLLAEMAETSEYFHTTNDANAAHA